MGAPLTLAAAATAAGFLSFLPTDYKGLSELGLLAGLGMIIAFITSITLIPALLTVLRPPGEPEEMGYKALAPVDRFMERHRIPIIVGTGLVVAAGLAVAVLAPVRLQSAQSEKPEGRIGCDLPGFAKRSRASARARSTCWRRTRRRRGPTSRSSPGCRKSRA